MNNRYQTQIEAGAAWLDDNVPDWVQVFAADRAANLHMADCGRCVLGYVLGSYWHDRSPVYRLGAVNPWEMDQDDDFRLDENWLLIRKAAEPLGFDLPETGDRSRSEHWTELRRGWQELIEKRLADQGLLV